MNETNNFKESLEKRIDTEIVRALPLCKKGLLLTVNRLLNEGNKFRSLLFYNASRCFGYDNKEVLLNIAASLEILHRGSLIHDDIADQSNIRGKHKSLHISQGNAAAIYVPNILRDYTENMLKSYPVIQKDLMRAYNELCFGQLYEGQLSRTSEATFDDYERIVSLKSAGFGEFVLGTAYYLAHKKKDKNTPKSIAKSGALLFQIVDDIQDLLNHSQDVPVDIINGVKSAPWFFLSQKQRKIKDINELQEALLQPNVLRKTYNLAESYLQELNGQIKSWMPDNIYRQNILDDIETRFKERTRSYHQYLDLQNDP